jgi:hypothetical protein
MQGYKANECTAKKQRTNASSGNEGKNQRTSVFCVGSQEISVGIVQKENRTIWPARLDSL